MNKSKLVYAATIAAICIPATAEARTQMRAVGSSTVYPFAKIVAERIARANPRLGTPIIESTGTGAGMKLFCAGVGERFPDVENASRRMKASEAKLCQQNGVTAITEIQVGLDGVTFATLRKTPCETGPSGTVISRSRRHPSASQNGPRTGKKVMATCPPCP